jgi:hypothetical protein
MMMKIGKGNQSTRRSPAPVPLCPPQIPHDLTWDRTRAAAVGSQRLTARALSSLTKREEKYLQGIYHVLIEVTFWNFLERFREKGKNPSQDSQCPRRESNWAPAEYESAVFPLDQCFPYLYINNFNYLRMGRNWAVLSMYWEFSAGSNTRENLLIYAGRLWALKSVLATHLIWFVRTQTCGEIIIETKVV